MLKNKELKFSEVVDVEFLNKLFRQYYSISKVPVGLLEPDGNILVEVGWQRVCTEFHRKGFFSCKNCTESDSHITKRLHEDPPIHYKCKNGLNDVAMPVVIEGQHLANLFFGQFFYTNDEINEEFFKEQAKINSFNEKDYLEALKDVPIYSEQEVDNILSFYMTLLDIIIKLGYTNLEKEIENKSLEDKIANKLHEIQERNKELNCLYKISGYSHEDLTEEEFFEKVLEVIPPSFQHSEICEVKIDCKSKVYKSKGYKKTDWYLKNDLIVAGVNLGKIEVCYVEKRKQYDHGPFLKEELSLIDGIAELIIKTIESKQKELEIKEKNEEYLAVNEELREKNEEFLVLNEELQEKNDEYQSLYEEYLVQNEELHEQNEEFQAVNEELEEEMEKRREVQEKLQEQYKAYISIFDNHPDILYVVDPKTYEVLFVNNTFQKMLGENPVGKKCYESFHGFNKPCDFCTNHILEENKGKSYTWEFHNNMLNVDLLITDQFIKWPDGRKVRFELAVDITERKKAEIELKEKNEEYQSLYEEYLSQNEELLEKNQKYEKINTELQKSHEQQLALFDGIEDVIYVADPDTYELLYFNETARGIWGENSVGKKCYKVLQDRDEPCPFCSNDKILGKNIGKHYVWEFQNEISKQWFRCADKAIRWSNGKMVRFELASDISNLKNTQAALNENQERLQTLLDTIPTGIVLIDKETRTIEEVNPYALGIIGMPEEKIINSLCTQYFCSAEEKQCPICDLNQQIDLSERTITKEDGTQVPILKSVKQLVINGKEKLLESFIDISKRKEAEKKLKVYEERLKLAMEGTTDGLWDWNLETNEIFFSKPWKKIIGYKDNELENTYEVWEALVHPDDVGQAKKEIDDYLKGKISIYECDFRMKHKKGHWVNILSRGKVNLNHKGEKVRFVGTHVDVTELRSVEKELHKEKDLIERYFSLVEALIVIIDTKGNISKVNRKACELLGYSEDELVGKHWFKTCLPQPEGKEIVYPVFQQIIAGDLEGANYFENEILTKDGERFYIAWHNNYMQDENGKVSGVISAGEDITEKKIAQQKLENTLVELERSNKELEQFAYVASHDLQEPLRKVKTFAELFAKKYTGAIDEKADQYIGYMTSGAYRMQSLILDLLAFSRVATRGKEFKKANLNNIVKAVLDDLQISIKESGAQIEVSDLPTIDIDEIQLMQVFQNLISNAIKFRSDQQPLINISVEDKKTHWQFCVADNGIGIEMQYADRIFEVFQRLHTKEEYKGTGIGLAICKKIIERHKGKIWMESDFQTVDKQRGSKFYFTINKKLNK